MKKSDKDRDKDRDNDEENRPQITFALKQQESQAGSLCHPEEKKSFSQFFPIIRAIRAIRGSLLFSLFSLFSVVKPLLLLHLCS